jgi:ABC-type dipeptide/oligopeptide/nickel transport system permease subunit
VAIFPGLFIFLTVLAFNFVGDALRTALDPRLAWRGDD